MVSCFELSSRSSGVGRRGLAEKSFNRANGVADDVRHDAAAEQRQDAVDNHDAQKHLEEKKAKGFEVGCVHFLNFSVFILLPFCAVRIKRKIKKFYLLKYEIRKYEIRISAA